MNDYDKQAEDFLKATGTTLEVVFQYTGPYFPGDKDKRDVYRFTLKNERGEYSATFGDSLHNTQRREFAQSCRGFSPDYRTAKRLGFKVLASGAIPSAELAAARKHKPGAYAILAGLDANDPGTFEDFISEFGYDERPLSDYPDVLKIYSAVLEQVRGLRRIFNRDELALLADIN